MVKFVLYCYLVFQVARVPHIKILFSPNVYSIAFFLSCNVYIVCSFMDSSG